MAQIRPERPDRVDGGVVVGVWRGIEVGGRRVAVVAGGGWTLGVTGALLDAGSQMVVIGPDPSPALADLAERGRVELITEPCTPPHLDDVALVVAGSDDHRALAAAAAARVPVCPIGEPHPEPVEEPSSATSSDDRSGSARRTGRVILVGGGPGDPGLLTVAGLEAIRTADVIATDRLAPLAALDQARADAEIVDVGKIPRGPGAEQQTIEELLIDRASAGRTVVRLKGGDSFVFGRGGEEWQACATAGIPVTVIPGVTSASAAPAAAGVPLTHRTLSQGFTVVTGHLPPDDPRTKINWAALATAGTTLVVMMGMANLAEITAALIEHGMDPATPALVVEDGTLPSMRTVRAPVEQIAARAAADGLGAPATVVIGAVAGFDPNQR